MRRMSAVIVLALMIPVITASAQKSTSEQRTARHYDSIRRQPSLLLAFLREMPKGGDLHNHLFGAIYAESLINFAARDNFCVDRTTSVLIAPPCDDACDRFASKPADRLCLSGSRALQLHYRCLVHAQLGGRRARPRSFLRHLRQISAGAV